MHTVARRTSLPLLVALLGTLLVPLLPQPALAVTATIVVDDPDDAPDAAPGDGMCEAVEDGCTLRAAVMEANGQGDDGDADDFVIQVPPGVYSLDIAPTGEEMDGADGDLDVRYPTVFEVGPEPLAGPAGTACTEEQTPSGESPPVTVDFAESADRLFDVHETSASFTGFCLDTGSTSDNGGALRVTGAGDEAPMAAQVDPATSLTFVDGVIADNEAFAGGGIYGSNATFSITDSTVAFNFADVAGGGLACEHCVVHVSGSIVDSNQVGGDLGGGLGGGLAIATPAGLQSTITGSHISGNFAGTGGGVAFAGETPASASPTTAAIEGAGTLAISGSEIGGTEVLVSTDGSAAPATHEGSGNFAEVGGGIAVSMGNVLLDASTSVHGNVAFIGGGVAVVPGFGPASDAEPAFHFGSGPAAVVHDGASVAGNEAIFDGGGYFLGGLLVRSEGVTPTQSEFLASVTVSGGEVSRNTSGGGFGSGAGGGGLYSDGGEITIQNGALIEENITSANGGGIYQRGAPTTITDSIVRDNVAGGVHEEVFAAEHGTYGNVGGDGGAIYQSGGLLRVTDTDPLDGWPTEITDNIACEGDSGENGVGATDGSPTPANHQCDAQSPYQEDGSGFAGRGGGIYVGELQEPTVITGATIAGNVGRRGGGLWMGGGDVVEIHDSTVADNRAIDGGGIYNETGDLTITGSLIGGPTAPAGEVQPPQPVANLDLGNAATNNGGGIWAAFNATTELLDTRVVSNVSGFGGAQPDAAAEPAVASHIDSGGGVYNLDSTLTVADTDPDDGLPADVSLNEARDAGCFSEGCAYGGGIYVGVDPSVVDITGVTFDHNVAHEGGALWVGSEDTVTVDASTFTDNWADYGGAVYQEGGSLTVTGSTFGGPGEGDGNGAWNEGGAIWADLLEVVENGAAEHVVRNELHVSGSDFIANTADTQGGAFWVQGNNNGPATDPLLTVTDGSVVGNASGLAFVGAEAGPETAAADGGGFWLGDVAARIDGTIIDTNTAHAFGNGGGIYLGGTGALDLIDALVSDNTAAWGAGLWMGFNDIVRVDGSTFAGNVADDVGGGIYNQGGSLDAVNSTLTDNEASDGAALYSGLSASSSLTNVTVNDNTATGDAEGGPAAVDEGASGVIVLTNTIVADNTPADCDGNITSNGYNIDTDGSCLSPAPAAVGDQPAVADAGLGELGDYGGPTPTVPLLTGSPAIDAGNDDVCADNAGGVDQRNVERPVDGDGDGDAQCDVGAFERTDPVVSVSATDDGAEAGPDHGSFTLTLAEPAPEAVTVTFGIAGTATRGTDYTLHRGSPGGTAISGSSVTIGAEATSVVVAVKVVDDAAVEDDETVVLTLTDASPGSVGTPPAGTVTIVDNDRDEQEPGGEDRIETSIEVASLHFERGSAPIVIIARNDDYADALTGAPLARFLDGPILLTTKDVLDPRIATFIRDYLGSTEAYILGETAAISEQVEAQLQTEAGITTIQRIGGINRFETSGDIARFLQARLGAAAFAPTQFHAGEVHVYVTEGIHPDPLRGWPDAVSVSGLAAEQLHPILLVRQDEVPVHTHQAVEDIGADSATIIGGPVAVSGDVEFALELTGMDVDRVGGVDRYDTSRLVADLMKANGMSPKFTWLATGLNFPDALVAGPAVAIDDGILLLIHGLDLDASPASEEWLVANGPAIDFLRFLGGPDAITPAVRDEVRAAID